MLDSFRGRLLRWRVVRVLRLLLPLALGATPACSLLVQSDDLLGGGNVGDGGSAPDGGTAVTDAGGSSDGDPGSGAACAAGFCDDFEGASKVVWRTDKSAGATIAVDTMKPKTGQRSLHASRPLGSGRDQASFVADLPGNPGSCELDVFAATTGASTALSFFLFGYGKLPSAYQSWQVSLGVGGGAAEYLAPAGGGAPTYHDAPIPALAAQGRWVHVRIDFIPGAKGSIDVSVDGTKVLTGFSIAPPPDVSAPFIEVGGVYQSNVGAGWDVFVDNVACTKL